MLAACWLTLLLAPAQADPAPPVALEPVEIALVSVVVAGPELDARAVEQAVGRATVRRRGVRVVLAADVGSLAGSQLRDCGPDAACIGAVLGETTVPLALMVVVNARVTPPVVAVRVVGAGRDGAVRAEQVSAIPGSPADGAGGGPADGAGGGPADGAGGGAAEGAGGSGRGAALAAGVERATAQVLDRLGHTGWARLVVRATPLDALVRVIEPVLGEEAAGASVWLPPGPARVRVEAPGHVAEELTLEVASDEDRTVEIVLEADDPWWQSPWFWSAVGVGVAAGVVGTVLVLPGGERCACVGHPSSPCSCP